MKLKDLKSWIVTLPEEFDEFDIVNAEIGKFYDGKGPNEGFEYRLDKPVTTLAVDKHTKEILILNDKLDTENGKKI